MITSTSFIVFCSLSSFKLYAHQHKLSKQTSAKRQHPSLCMLLISFQDTTFEAKAKDSEKVRSQGPSCQGQKGSRPRLRTRGHVWKYAHMYSKCKHCNYDFTAIQA